MASETEINKLRRKLGDSEAYAFEDAELAEILNEEPSFNAALEAGLWELLTVTARWNSYTVGTRREDKQQVFNNILRLYESVAALNGSGSGAEQQIGFLDILGSETSRPARDYSRLLLEVL